MNWSDVGRTVAQWAPLLGGVLMGPGGAAAGSILAQAVGARPHPAEVSAILERSDMGQTVANLERQHAPELRRLTLEAETARIAQVNETMRAEAKSSDAYVRRWRPTWGYATAAAWSLQTLAIVVCMLGATRATLHGQHQAVTALMEGAATLAGALTVQWSVALGVLGINVSARSRDKQTAAGHPPQGWLGGILQRLGRAGG